MPAANTIGPFARHHFAVPAQNSVRRHESRDLRKQATTETVSQSSQSTTLTVVESQSVSRETSLQDTILFTEERDYVGLLTMEPTAQSREQ